MCGIAGAIALGSGPSEFSDPLDRVVESMAMRLIHRGPDSSGIWNSPSGGIALAHRRLAIFDLTETGQQPMEYAGRFWITFNGEIYNFRELRAQLLALGHTFRGESDTEVLLAAIAQWGIEKALCRCVGMFAFAVWDARDRVLHLARDRMGEKPLYLGEISAHLFFASELRAFRAIPGFNARVSARAANAYLRDGCVPGALSIYEGIYKLPPGHLISIRCGHAQRLSTAWPLPSGTASSSQLTPRPYWSCREAAFSGQQSLIKDVREAIDEGQALLSQAIRAQMQADVPTGAFLSGGIDSSLIAAVMQHQSPRAIRTFTVAFDDPRFDESRHARAIAAHLGSRHEEFVLREREIIAEVPSIIPAMDEPTANGSFFPVYMISRLARTQVTVALSGDGGDELFAGYNRYALAPAAWRRSRWLPAPLRRPLSMVLSAGGCSEQSWLLSKMTRLGSQVASDNARRKLAEVLRSHTFQDTYLGLTSWCATPLVVGRTSQPPPRNWPAEFGADLPSMLLADQLNYLPDDNLAKVDRASMAASLETRLPLLDHRIVEFSWRLPPELKLKGNVTKCLLRAILDRYVPRSLIERPKMGFSVPIDNWLRGPLRNWAGDMVGSSAFHRMFATRPGQIRQLWDDFLARRGPSAGETWAIVALSGWAEAAAAETSIRQPCGPSLSNTQ